MAKIFERFWGHKSRRVEDNRAFRFGVAFLLSPACASSCKLPLCRLAKEFKCLLLRFILQFPSSMLHVLAETMSGPASGNCRCSQQQQKGNHPKFCEFSHVDSSSVKWPPRAIAPWQSRRRTRQSRPNSAKMMIITNSRPTIPPGAYPHEVL